MKINQIKKLFLRCGYITLAWIFSLTFCFSVYASPQDKADEIISSSREAAQQMAENLFMSYLLRGFQNAMVPQAEISRVLTAVGDIYANISGRQKMIQDLGLEVEDSLAILEDQFSFREDIDESVERSMEAFLDAKKKLRLDLYSLGAAATTADQAGSQVKAVFKHIKEACEKGVGAPLVVPNLPPISVMPPPFSFGFNIVVGDGNYSSSMGSEDRGSGIGVSTYGNPGFHHLFKGSSDAGDYGSAVAGLSYLGTYYLAVASGAAAESTAAYLLAGAYFIAIVAIIYIVLDHHQKSKAKEQAGAVEQVYKLKANSKDVAKNFKKICQNKGNSLLEISRLLEAGQNIASPSDSEVTHAKKVQEKFIELFEAQNSLHEKLIGQGKTKKETEEEVLKSAEFKATQKYTTETLGIGGVAKVLRTQLTLIHQESKKASQQLSGPEMKKTKQQVYRQLFENLGSLKEKIFRLYQMSYRHSLGLENRERLKKEFLVHKKAAQLYIKWQTGLADFLVASFNDRPTQKIESQLQEILLEAEGAYAESPQMKTFEIISKRLKVFLGAIE